MVHKTTGAIPEPQRIAQSCAPVWGGIILLMFADDHGV